MHHPLRAAIIGTGFAGAQHADGLRRLGIEVRSIIGSEPERARASAARLGVERSSAEAAFALEDPDVDVVHICVPNALHAPLVRAAFAAGKHVVCEKPLATTTFDALDLARLAREARGIAVLCHSYRFYPMAAELRLRVARGDLGIPHLVRGVYLQDWLLSPDATSWRVDPLVGGASRTVADIGTHWVDLAETVVGQQVAAVTAWIGTVHRRRLASGHAETFARGGADEWTEVQTEDEAAILLRFSDGAFGSVTLSQVSAGHQNDLRLAVDGIGGSAEWRQEDPDHLRVSVLDRSTEIVVRDRAALSTGAAALARLPAGHGEGWADALRNLLEAAYAEMVGDRSAAAEEAAPLPTFDDGARHVAFVEAVLRSHATGRWVEIGAIVDEVQAAHRLEVPS